MVTKDACAMLKCNVLCTRCILLPYAANNYLMILQIICTFVFLWYVKLNFVCYSWVWWQNSPFNQVLLLHLTNTFNSWESYQFHFIITDMKTGQDWQECPCCWQIMVHLYFRTLFLLSIFSVQIKWNLTQLLFSLWFSFRYGMFFTVLSFFMYFDCNSFSLCLASFTSTSSPMG